MSVVDKAKQIRALLLDVDGVLTNGVLYYADNTTMRGFYLHDGIGIKLLHKVGIKVGIISAKTHEAVYQRAREINIEHVYLGYEDKTLAYENFKQKVGLKDEQIAYIGDDLPDLPLLRKAGLAITVPKAPAVIKQYVDIITKNKGGKGAVREICEYILKAQDHFDSVLQSYLS